MITYLPNIKNFVLFKLLSGLELNRVNLRLSVAGLKFSRKKKKNIFKFFLPFVIFFIKLKKALYILF